MLKPLQTSISRRSLLKLSAVSATLLAIPIWSTNVIAQASNAIASKGGSPKPNGLISFNAGWMIPVEDQKPLLALEEQKLKEAKAVIPQAGDNNGQVDTTKSVKKTWSDKLKEALSQVKSYF